mgnify:CR=1 FL=1
MKNLKRILLVLTIALTTLTGCKKEPIDDTNIGYRIQLVSTGSEGDCWQPPGDWTYYTNGILIDDFNMVFKLEELQFIQLTTQIVTSKSKYPLQQFIIIEYDLDRMTQIGTMTEQLRLDVTNKIGSSVVFTK